MLAKTTARGYGGPHQKLRRRWKPIVDAGNAYCHAILCLLPDRVIIPGTPWNLGHTPDRTGWTGPEHELCNKSDGARITNRGRTKIKMCPVCGATYRANYPDQRTCGRQCGWVMRRAHIAGIPSQPMPTSRDW